LRLSSGAERLHRLEYNKQRSARTGSNADLDPIEQGEPEPAPDRFDGQDKAGARTTKMST
jgi:hypothetical protein